MNLYMQPLLLWNQLACDVSELAFASSRLIYKHTNSPAGKGNNSGDKLASPGQEKVETAMESAQMVGMQLFLVNQQFMSLAIKQMLSASSTLISMAGSRTPSEVMHGQAKLARETVDSSAVSASTLSTSTAKVGRSVVKPVLKRVKKDVRKTRKR